MTRHDKCSMFVLADFQESKDDFSNNQEFNKAFKGDRYHRQQVTWKDMTLTYPLRKVICNSIV